MHRYNTRFAAMNRSFAPAVYEETDDEYVPSMGSWNSSSGRRPVTRSMTQSVRDDLSAVYGAQYVARNANLNKTIDLVLAYSAQCAPQTRVEVSHRRPVTRSMTAPAPQNTRAASSVSTRAHSMVLRSSRR